MTPRPYDAIVIGSGQGGNPLVSALAAKGRKTALIERKHIGGTCINEGCTPTKTMVASARVAYLARRASDYGVKVSSPEMSMEKVRQRKRDIVDLFRGGTQKRLEATENLDIVWGEASFVDAKKIRVALRDGGTTDLTAPQIFINTGTRASIPKLDGLDSVSFLDNESIMELTEVPEHLLILGGGYIGVEFAQMFRRFGAKVSIVHNGSQLLAHEDEDIAQEIEKIFTEDGITLHLNANAVGVRASSGGITLDFTQDENRKSVDCTHLLIATGRTPNTPELGLENTSIATDEHGYIRVNERLETGAEGVYALGDVKGGPAFTHISYDDFRILRDNLLEGKPASTANRMVPYTVFTDPQLGRIGMTESEARKSGRTILIARMPMTSVARALEMDETRGVMKAIVDAKSEEILGVAILGIEGGEIASLVQVAMMGKLTSTQLINTTFSHPTLAESLNNLFLKLQ
jgi:pyruvate/2-oxoglutarate dehydrogenase complex dihydrolipoamide dehydrogenase (E3) component